MKTMGLWDRFKGVGFASCLSIFADVRFSWEGRPPCRPTYHLALIKRRKMGRHGGRSSLLNEFLDARGPKTQREALSRTSKSVALRTSHHRFLENPARTRIFRPHDPQKAHSRHSEHRRSQRALILLKVQNRQIQSGEVEASKFY